MRLDGRPRSREPSRPPDEKKCEARLQRIQQLMREKVMVAPIWQNAVPSGIGPRVGESGIGLITESRSPRATRT
jgi:hypothetical protein